MSGKSFAAVMAVLGIVALLAFGVIAKGGRQLEIGEAAPVAEVPVLAAEDSKDAGEMGSLADYRGRWVLVNIWASWCLPCEDESPDLVAFQDEHSGPGFTILGIQTQDGTNDGLEFEREFDLNYRSLRDGSGDYAEDLGAVGVPETILLDPEGDVAYYRPGPITPEMLDAEVLPLIESAKAREGS